MDKLNINPDHVKIAAMKASADQAVLASHVETAVRNIFEDAAELSPVKQVLDEYLRKKNIWIAKSHTWLVFILDLETHQHQIQSEHVTLSAALKTALELFEQR